MFDIFDFSSDGKNELEEEMLDTVGYVANGVNTKANGTSTAGRIYDKVGDKFTVKVLFATSSKVIAQVTAFDTQRSHSSLTT